MNNSLSNYAKIKNHVILLISKLPHSFKQLRKLINQITCALLVACTLSPILCAPNAHEEFNAKLSTLSLFDLWELHAYLDYQINPVGSLYKPGDNSRETTHEMIACHKKHFRESPMDHKIWTEACLEKTDARIRSLIKQPAEERLLFFRRYQQPNPIPNKPAESTSIIPTTISDAKLKILRHMR